MKGIIHNLFAKIGNIVNIFDKLRRRYPFKEYSYTLFRTTGPAEIIMRKSETWGNSKGHWAKEAIL